MKYFSKWWPVVLLFLFIACKKEESSEAGKGLIGNSGFYIRCKIDGTAKTFNIGAAAGKQDLGGSTFSYSIYGKAVADATNLESIGFTIQISPALMAGTYTETNSTSGYYLAGVYNPNTTHPEKIYAGAMDATDPLQVTVKEITENLVSGTFKGKMYLNSTAANPAGVTITEGEFKVKIR